MKIAPFATVLLLINSLSAQNQPVSIDPANWGKVVSPVYGSTQVFFGSGAELFAGPNQFGKYYNGVLPNGRVVRPAGDSIQVGMKPLGVALTPDGKYLITTNNDERDTGLASNISSVNLGGYSLSVIDTASLTVVSQINSAGNFFVGLQVTGSDPYTVWASAGPDNAIRLFNVSSAGIISKGTPATIPIAPITAATAGNVSSYIPDPALNTADAGGFRPPVPSSFSRTAGAKITFPAGSALSPDGKFLYVACNGDNSIAVIDTAAFKVVRQLPVGYFPYSVSVSSSGDKVLVSNWGVTEYKFYNPAFDPATGNLTSVAPVDGNQPEGFYVAGTQTTGLHPKTSSVSILRAPGGDGAKLARVKAIYQGMPLDDMHQVGDTHPSATAIVRNRNSEILYVTKSNNDSIGLIDLANNTKLADLDLSPISITVKDGHPVHGTYPNALAVSPDNTRVYVAEAGLNAVAVLDTKDPSKPRLLGRIPAGWYPSALAVSSDGRFLYIANAKGVGEDIDPSIDTTAAHQPTGLPSNSKIDSNYIFGSVQKVDLAVTAPDNQALSYNFHIASTVDTSVVPAGGGPSSKIKHVFFILHENKTFDSMLGNLTSHFGRYAGTTFNDQTGKPYTNGQYTGVSLNLQSLATKFSTAVNYYSDSEESDAGHNFAASGTASDYTEKTLDVKSGRGLLVNKNFEPEDYPEGGYIFNNAARNGVSFKDYGALIRLDGTDTGTSTPTTLSDPNGGSAGYPQLREDKFSLTSPLNNLGDVDAPTLGMGQSYFLSLPMLAVLGQKNANGEPRIDRNYPGYNFNISDQRRAKEFIADFDRMLAANTLPQFLYIYQPNDHTGGVQAPNATAVGTSPVQQVADGDVALGMVVNHIMSSPVYYNADTGEGSAIFITWDDAQATVDHIHPHRTPLVVVSPYAKPGFVATRHYSTASVVKTEELLLGLPPNNLGDLFATDLRDMFQPAYNGAAAVPVTRTADYVPSREGSRIWQLALKLDLSGPDRDSARLGELARLSMRADDLHHDAEGRRRLNSRAYKSAQKKLYKQAEIVLKTARRDSDD